MSTLAEWFILFERNVWSPPLLIFLAAVGLYLTIRLRFVQFRYFGYAHKLAFIRDDSKAQGDISHFQSLMTALAATIGMGSIAGVATAIVAGGLGAVFWMWMMALIGMATKYAEAILAIKFRTIDAKGETCGGPMYYIEKGLNAKWLAVIFSIFGVCASFGIGNMVQANSVADAAYELFAIDAKWMGLLLMIITALALVGGIHSISKIVSFIVPTMALFYIIGGVIIILLRIDQVPAALMRIVSDAFTGRAAFGGAVGSSFLVAIQYGVSRGIFSSEAGMGSSPIAAAAARTDTPSRQALVSMSSVFITTGIICTITALVIATSGALGMKGVNGEFLNGSALAIRAFDQTMKGGSYIVTLSLIPFAYSTILGWAFYGERFIEYLFGIRAIVIFRIIFVLALYPGAMYSLDFVWAFSNAMNGLMAIPNLIALVLLTRIVIMETRQLDHLRGDAL